MGVRHPWLDEGRFDVRHLCRLDPGVRDFKDAVFAFPRIVLLFFERTNSLRRFVLLFLRIWTPGQYLLISILGIP